MTDRPLVNGNRCLMSSLEQFLADNPTGCLHVHAASVSISEVAWLARRTRGRPVLLATTSINQPFHDVEQVDLSEVAEFVGRVDVRVVDWSKLDAGTKSGGSLSWDTPLIFVETDNGDGRVETVYISSDPLADAAREVQATATPACSKRRWSLRTAVTVFVIGCCLVAAYLVLWVAITGSLSVGG